MLTAVLAFLIAAPAAPGDPGLPAEAFNQTRIYFGSSRDGDTRIYAIFADGVSERLVIDSAGRDSDPAVSPDAKRLAFASDRGGGDWNIYVANIDGSGQRQLTFAQGVDESPVFNPDGTKIAFTTYRLGHAQIYTMNLDGSDQGNISKSPDHEYSPDWSPDGGRIVFSRVVSNQTNVWDMRPDGTDKRQLTTYDSNDRGNDNSVYSPEGQSIAFVDGRQIGNQSFFDLGLIDADGRNRRRFTTTSRGVRALDWSPDASSIVFSEYNGYLWEDLWMIAPDGDALRRLTQGSNNRRDNFPAFGIQPTMIFPATVTVTRGEAFEGGRLSLFYSDDEYLWVEARRPSSVSQPSIEVELHAAAPETGAQVLSFVVEASAMFDTIPQWVDLYNFRLSRWERMVDQPATTNDGVVVVRIIEGASEYIQPLSGTVRARVAFYDPGIPVAFWFARIDQAVWVVTP